MSDDAVAEPTRRDPRQLRRWVVLVKGQRDQIICVQRAARKVGATITTNSGEFGPARVADGVLRAENRALIRIVDDPDAAVALATPAR